MAYATQNQSHTRMNALVAVGAIHAIGIYVLATGLAGGGAGRGGLAGAIVEKLKDHRTEARNIEVTVPLPPTPPKPRKPDPDPNQHPTTQPTGPISQGPIIATDPTPAHPTPAPTADPMPPQPPSPHNPSFTPKAARAIGNPSNWASSNDYPSLDYRLNHEGIAHFSLSISATGQVDSCIVTQSSGWPGLDTATCKLLFARAHFTPANDENGARVTGSYASAIHWVLPE